MEAAMKTEHGRYVSKAIYTILTLNIEGKKELLGLYLSDQEGAHHWLYNRGDKYPLVITFWRNKWPTLTTYFKYPTICRRSSTPPIGGGGASSVPQTDQDQGRLRQRKQLTQAALCRYHASNRALDASGAEL